MSGKNSVFLLLGGNIGNRIYFLQSAEQLIVEKIGPVACKSSIYETQPWGSDCDKPYLNMAMQVYTYLQPEDLLDKIHEVEAALGRVRGPQQYAPRTLDVDIIFFNNQVINTSRLIVPHPRMQSRMFVLKPLEEIAGKYIHPVLKCSVSSLLDSCTDNCRVEPFFITGKIPFRPITF